MVNVIAEIGINHQGSLDIAKTLINHAKESNCWGVKFQYRDLKTFYNSTDEIGDGIIAEELERINLTLADFSDLTLYARSLGLKVGMSVFRVEDFMQVPDIYDFYKVPSSECLNTPLIDIMLERDRQVIVSTGGHSIDDVQSVLHYYKDKITVLHCVSNYPTRLGHQNFDFIHQLRDWCFDDVGYSSHDEDIEAVLMSLCFDIKWLERHITLDKTANGLDHSTSSDLEDFKKINRFIENLPGTIDTKGSINQGEILNMQNLSTGLYAKKDLSGVVKYSDFDIKAPRKGISVGKFLQEYIGKELLRPVSQGDALSVTHFKPEVKIDSHDIAVTQEKRIGIPVRLHDFNHYKQNIPVGTYEFHLTYQELLSPNLLDAVQQVSSNDHISIHLPDYISNNRLVDPVSSDGDIKSESRKLIEITRTFADALQDKIQKDVPIVGSFSVLDTDKFTKYDNLFDYINNYKILVQWLPVWGWYFGGASKISAFNSAEDIQYINKNDINICLDLCHLILSANYYKQDYKDWYCKLVGNTKHIHIADAEGVDSEGLEMCDDRLDFFKDSCDLDCLKIIEVWQGHLNNGEKFVTEIQRLTR